MRKRDFLKRQMLLVSGIILFVSCEKEQLLLPEHSLSSGEALDGIAACNYISYSKSPACLGDPVTVTFDNGYSNNCGKAQLQMSTDGGATWVQVAHGTPANGMVSYTFTPPAEGKYDFQGSWKNTKGPSCLSAKYNIGFKEGRAKSPLEVINCICHNEFGAELVCGNPNTLTLLFITRQAGPVVIQGGLNPSVTVVSASSNVLIQNKTHPVVLNSNDNVTRWEGYAEACQEVSITITFSGNAMVGSWLALSGHEILGETSELSCD